MRHRAVLCCCGMCIVFVCAADEEAEAEAVAEARNQKQMYLDSSFVNVCVQCQDPAGFHPFIKVVVALIRLLCIFSLLL